MSSPNIIQVMETVFSSRFKAGWLRGDSWKAWRSFLAAVFALPMNADALDTYHKHTGRSDAPDEQFREVYAIVGRRGGKSAIAALIATYLAVFRDYSEVLAPGEQGVVMLLAADRRQAMVLLKYINSFFDRIPMLKRMVLSQTRESLTLTNRIQIEVHTTSFRTIRGYTVVAAICDELAYWRAEDSANPDTEVLTALRPAMSTIPNALLLAISSPFARRGALWEAHKEHFGKSGSPVLVWQADTRSMNPTVNRAVIAAAYLRDHAAASAEYGAQFRTDVESLFSRDVLERLVIPGRSELPPVPGRDYMAFVDPSGGSSDSMTLAIAHRERDKGILDLVREAHAPFSPESITDEFCADLKRYGVSTVVGDAYAGNWPRDPFEKQGIRYKVSELHRSELYLGFLPQLMSGTVELLDHPRLILQLCRLQRRTARLGRDSVDHIAGQHDDVANATAGVLVEIGLGHRIELTYADMVCAELDARQADAESAAEAMLNGRPCDCDSQLHNRRGPVVVCAGCGAQWSVEKFGPPPSQGQRIGVYGTGRRS